MANWISHLMIVDKLFAMGVDLDERGFAVGNIAPDCNVENEDWTEYTPSREITHWMHGESKLTADYEGFYRETIKDKVSLRGAQGVSLGILCAFGDGCCVSEVCQRRKTRKKHLSQVDAA